MTAPTPTVPIKQALAKATSEFIQSTTRLVDWVHLGPDGPTVQIPRHVEAWRDALSQTFPRSMTISACEAVNKYQARVEAYVASHIFHA